MIAKLFIVGPFVLVAIVLFRATFVFQPPPKPTSCSQLKGHKPIKLTDQMLDRYKQALNIKTISYAQHNYNKDALVEFHLHLERSFPLLHNASFVKKEVLANYTLLYTVTGTNPKLRPYMLTSHMDVVPAVYDKWSSDPFEAVLKQDRHVYARGTIDAKHLLMSMLEAFERLIADGFKPKRGIMIVFGHDEEVSGVEGAQTVATELPKRLKAGQWDKLEFILDEGNVIITTRFPGLDADLAMVGVVEKGYMTVKISTVGAFGHGSIPPAQTAISKLAGAIAKFNAHVMPSYMGMGVEREMIDQIAAYAKWPYKLVYANFWLFKPILEYLFSVDPAMNSVIRTSTAVTMIDGGTKENVLPIEANAYINHRVHPLESVEFVLDYDRRVINDPTIQVSAHGHATGPSPVAPYCEDCQAFQLIKHTTLQIYPDVVVIPSVFLAASDSRWYTNLTDAIYKFAPIAIPLEETKLFHGHDERISVDNYERLINFYHHLIQNANQDNLMFNFASSRDEL